MLPTSSPRVSAVIKLANAIARDYEQEYVGTEHVLLAIAREGTGLGAKVLEKRGVSEERLRGRIEALMKKQMEETWVFGRLPGTPHFKNVFGAAVEQCQNLKAEQVCTEHLLLALLKEKGSVAEKALRALGLCYQDVRNDIVELASS